MHTLRRPNLHSPPHTSRQNSKIGRIFGSLDVFLDFFWIFLDFWTYFWIFLDFFLDVLYVNFLDLRPNVEMQIFT